MVAALWRCCDFFSLSSIARTGAFTFLVCETIQQKLERCLLRNQDVSSFMEAARGAADLWRIILYHESAVHFPSYSTSHKRYINAGAIRKSKIPAATEVSAPSKFTPRL